MKFFRVCPACGRGFHIKLVSKNLLHAERAPVPGKWGVNPQRPGYLVPSTRLVEGRPGILDIREFQQVYKCEKCGHEWSEKHTDQTVEG